MTFARITVRPDQTGGVPCVRDLRIPVATVVGMVADGMSDPEIFAAYPGLEAEDVREAMRYAAEVVRERELPLVALRGTTAKPVGLAAVAGALADWEDLELSPPKPR